MQAAVCLKVTAVSLKWRVGLCRSMRYLCTCDVSLAVSAITADAKSRAGCRSLAEGQLRDHPDVRLLTLYNEPLSHMIYAAGDFVLVPSMFEPCGLTQLIAMRYGTIPIVRSTGGLADTVKDVDASTGDESSFHEHEHEQPG